MPAAYSGKYTGRTPKDKHIVREAQTESDIWWDANRPLEPEDYQTIRTKIGAYLADRPKYVVDTYAGADPEYRIAVRFVVERPYHALFIRQLLIRPTAEELATFVPEWTVLD
ncbi:phosphoenolpyruvate carboxykinase (ATP), partial [archaeon]